MKRNTKTNCLLPVIENHKLPVRINSQWATLKIGGLARGTGRHTLLHSTPPQSLNFQRSPRSTSKIQCQTITVQWPTFNTHSLTGPMFALSFRFWASEKTNWRCRQTLWVVVVAAAAAISQLDGIIYEPHTQHIQCISGCYDCYLYCVRNSILLLRHT